MLEKYKQKIYNIQLYTTWHTMRRQHTVKGLHLQHRDMRKHNKLIT